MSSVNFAPIFNGWQGFTPDGIPLAGGLVSTFVAGTSTPAATYTDSSGGTANSNPIQLDAGGRPPAEIWLSAGQAYKFVLTDSLSNTLATYDNIAGIPYASGSVWSPSGLTPTYLSATQFSVVGNQTALFTVGLRIRYTLTSTLFYGTVTASAFGAGVTIVTVAVDATPLTSALNSVDVSQITPTNSPLPVVSPLVRMKAATTSRTGTSLVDDADLVVPLASGSWIFRLWAPIWGTSPAGSYGFRFEIAFSGAVTSGAFTEDICINGTGSVGSLTHALNAPVTNSNTFTNGTSPVGADWLRLTGSIIVGSPGNLSFQWCQQVAGSPAALNVGLGAWLECVKII